LEVINRKLIFIIEDCRDIQQLIQLLFVREGYQVQCASNGQIALEMLTLSQQVPALILLDLMMPVMDGFLFRKEQKLDPRLADIPVVVMTADVNAEAQATKLGAIDHLKKPIPLQKLLNIAAAYCS
jgi:CheY-like chemotaxis protein